MTVHRDTVLHGEKLLLLGEMLREIRPSDTSLFFDIAAGFQVTCYLGAPYVFPAKDAADFEEPVNVEWLWENSREIRENVIQAATDARCSDDARSNVGSEVRAAARQAHASSGAGGASQPRCPHAGCWCIQAASRLEGLRRRGPRRRAEGLAPHRAEGC